MGRCKNGEAISPAGRSAAARKTSRRFLDEARSHNDVDVWRRARGMLGYIEGRRVVDLAADLDVTRGSVNRWLQWYETLGVEGLVTGKPPGPAPKLREAQRDELTALIESGPSEAGYTSGVWTGPMIGDLIAQRFGVRYHNHHVPRLLHELGFSVQRPRRRLARADAEAQAVWLRKKLPTIKNRVGSIDPVTMQVREYFLGAGTGPRRPAVTSDDTIYYTDYARGKLGRLNPTTGETKEWNSPSGAFSQPYAATAAGNIVWYVEGNANPNMLVRFDPATEKFQTWPIPSGGGVVRHMVAAPDGSLWLAGSEVDTIGKVEVRH